MARRPSLDHLDHFHDNKLYLPTRTISIEEDDDIGVDPTMAMRYIKNLHILESINSDPITIILSTYGGSVFDGMAIYDAIRACKSHIIIKATGPVMSMGSLILQAADERFMSPHSVMMIHHGYDSHDDHVKNVRNWVDFGKKYDSILNKIYLNKIKEKHPDFKMKKLDELLNFDTILLAEEAIELGLCDKISGQEENNA